MKNKRIPGTLTILRYNLLIAWRNLKKNRTTSLINVLGLAIGISAFLAILNLVNYELSFNADIPDKDRIYRIYTEYSGSFSATNNGVARPIGPYVEDTFTGLDATSYFMNYAAKVKIPEDGDQKDIDRQNRIILAANSYFEVVDEYEWLAGHPETALEDPFQVVLTEEQATNYFGAENWIDLIGREIIYQDSLKVSVSGIVKQPDHNSDFDFTDIISFATLESSWLKDRFGDDQAWGNTNSGSQLWVKSSEGTVAAQILMQLEDLGTHVNAQTDNADWTQHYKLQSLSDLHFNTELGIFDSSRSPAHLPTLTILGVVAVAILLIAIFNFVNLETAQSTTKSKEVGVRKVLGSPRKSLVGRFLTESVLISLLASLIAIPLAHYGLVYFEDFVPAGISLDYADPIFWLTLLGIAVGVGTLAGVYPSWVISSFRPIKALHPSFSAGTSGGSFVRKSLIFLQFLFSQLLIVGTLAISWQISFMLDKELGFDGDGVLYFYTPYYEDYSKQQLLLNKIEEMPEIRAFAKQASPPVQNGYSTSVVKYDTPNGEMIFNPHQKSGDTSYFHFYKIKLLAGTNLIPNDTLPHFIINETFMNEVGFDDPRDAINFTCTYNSKEYTVVGVMEDFHFRSLHHPIEPMLFRYQEESRCIAIRVQADEIGNVVNTLTDRWSEIYPDNPLTVGFMDETIERFYNTEKRASKLASIATVIAILISCLGLFGLISFTIVQKSKEIGIRKVLGASLYHLSQILTKEFIVLIVISFLISTPFSYYFIMQWMENFAYKTEVSWWIYLLGGVSSVLIAVASIGVKVWRASNHNPIDSLRYE